MCAMRFKPVSRHGSRLIVPVVLFVTATSLTSLGLVLLKIGPLPMRNQSVKAASAMPVQPVVPSQQTDVVLVTLTTNGFDPGEMTHPEGRFLFGINNGSGLSDLTFRLTTSNGIPKAEKRLPRGQVWRRVLELPAGLYALRVTDHPDWTCSLTITAR